MAPPSPHHERIIDNVYRLLADHARDVEAEGPLCRVSTRTVNLRVPSGSVYYPDVMVVCNAEPDEHGMEHSPCLLVEVMTPGLETIDQSEKWPAYNRIPSLRMYLVIDPYYRRVRRFFRTSRGEWLWAVDGDDGEFKVPCPQTYLKLDWIYEGVQTLPLHPG